MTQIGQIERATQNRIVKFFQEQLGYVYYGNWEERDGGSACIEEVILLDYLKSEGYNHSIAKKAVGVLFDSCKKIGKGLYAVNKEVYIHLRYGISVKTDIGEQTQRVHFINWREPLKNIFAIAEEVTVLGTNAKRPDIVVYVNGIAMGMVELKRSTVSVGEGIRQLLDNQSDKFIASFFPTIQLCVAGNDTEGAKYGVIETKSKYYLPWKNDDNPSNLNSKKINTVCDMLSNKLDKDIVSLFDKERFLDIIYNYVVYDRGVKKTARPNQYFGVQESQSYINQNKGGIIWHTQGSGKSLTMVWLAQWILENNPEARVLIITDRDELDEQIEKVFEGVEKKIYRTKSGADLINQINTHENSLVCSLIHKFKRNTDESSTLDVDLFIEELKNSLPDNFTPKGKFYIFVDECHRTQSGKLHFAMKEILKESIFIGFTGTPLLKKDKQTSLEIFGSYIHTYKFDDAVKDNVVLDLRYEARDVPQYITSQDKIDEWFEAKTSALTTVAKAQLKSRWGTIQKIFSSKERLNRIASDIVLDMSTKPRLMNGRGNAMLVATSIYQACRYYDIFLSMGFNKCAIVTSYTPNIADIKGEGVSEDGETENIEKYNVYTKMINRYFNKKDEDKISEIMVKTFEEEVKEKFIKEPEQMKLLIVVDKLLTGFDAPPATYLYIDKTMQDHGLFQAICRVNRLDPRDNGFDGLSKEYGYIIDYKQLFGNVEKSILDYTSGAFDNYEKSDVEGLLKNRIEEAKKHLQDLLNDLYALCEPVKHPKQSNNYYHYFVKDENDPIDVMEENSAKRETLYRLTASLIRAYAEIKPDLRNAGFLAKEIEELEDKVNFYIRLRDEIKLVSGDYLDIKDYERDMRHLIDCYIGSQDSQKLTSFNDMSLLELLIIKGFDVLNDLPNNIRENKDSVAEVIENNVRKRIIEKQSANPLYFSKMSSLLEELILKRKQGVLVFKKLLEEYQNLARIIENPETNTTYPKAIINGNSSALRSLYDNLNNNEELAIKLHETIIMNRPDNYKETKSKVNKMKYIILSVLGSEDEMERVYKIISEQDEYDN